MSQELDDLSDAIDDQALKPRATSADGVSIQRSSLKEQDDHYDRKANREAAASGGAGVRFFNTKPPGAT